MNALQTNLAHRRRGATAVMVVMSLVVLLGMASLTLDLGLVYRARADLQATADAAAMAAAWELLDEDRLTGSAYMTEELLAARNQAVAYAAANKVLGAAPTLDANYANSGSGDIVIGYLEDPNDPTEALSLANAAQFNTVMVRVRRDEERNGPIDLLFARIFGRPTTTSQATAAATFKDGVVGFRVTEKTGNAGLLPLALHVDTWNNLITETNTIGDQWSYNKDTDTVAPGADGTHEVNLYPGNGQNQLPPGNFGTVDIGSPNNSTADLSRQIRYGVNADDLAYFGGEFKLGEDGTILLNGDTGLSAGIKDDLLSVIGQPRTIPLFDQVTGNGNNAMFRVVGFAGVRIMDVKLTGPMNKKAVVIQPAYVVDDSVLTEPGSGSSYYVYEPVRLTR